MAEAPRPRRRRMRAVGTLPAALAATLLLGACTAQDRYRSIYNEKLRQCDIALSEVERERCLESLPPESYEEYERQLRTIPAAKRQ